MTTDTTTLYIGGLVLAFLILVLILVLSRRGKRRVGTQRPDEADPYVARTDRPYVRAPEPQPTATDFAAHSPPPSHSAPAPQQSVTSAEAQAAPAAASEDTQGSSIPDSMATAAADVAGQFLQAKTQGELPGSPADPDDLQRLKGVGPKFQARLNELGITRYDQLARLSGSEVETLDAQLGPFRGRLTRDRLTEQASYLARGDLDGFEERFGKLGG